MSEGMSDERLARLSSDNEPRGDHLSGLTADEVSELLDEVKRLRAINAYHAGTSAYAKERLAERDAARRSLAWAEKQISDMDDQLGEIGEIREEWAADGPAGWMQDPTGADPERYARSIVKQAAERGVVVKLKRRLAGEWREVSDA